MNTKSYELGYKAGRIVASGALVGIAAFGTGLMSFGAGIAGALAANRLTGFAVSPQPWKEILVGIGYFSGIGSGAVLGTKYLLIPAMMRFYDEIGIGF